MFGYSGYISVGGSFSRALLLLAIMLSSVTWCAAHLVTLTGIPGLIAKAAAAGTFSGGFLFAFYQPQITQLVKKALQKG